MTTSRLLWKIFVAPAPEVSKQTNDSWGHNHDLKVKVTQKTKTFNEHVLTHLITFVLGCVHLTDRYYSLLKCTFMNLMLILMLLILFRFSSNITTMRLLVGFLLAFCAVASAIMIPSGLNPRHAVHLEPLRRLSLMLRASSDEKCRELADAYHKFFTKIVQDGGPDTKKNIQKSIGVDVDDPQSVKDWACKLVSKYSLVICTQ